MKIIFFINKYFWVFFILGILIGIFSPNISLLSPYIMYMLMFVLFLSCLKINFQNFFKNISLKLILYLSFLILILTPLFFYFIFNIFLEFEYGLAILILVAMPAGMTIPVYAAIFKGDLPLALTLTIFTSILAPFTVPTLIYFLTGIQTNVNIFNLFTFLATIIFIPLILAIIFRSFGKKIIIKTKRYYNPISILIITTIIMSAIAKVNLKEMISFENLNIIIPFLSLFIVAALLHLIGYFAVFKNTKTRITSSLATAYMNSTLAIVFAAQFFSPKTLLIVTLYQIPTNLILIGFGCITKKYLVI